MTVEERGKILSLNRFFCKMRDNSSHWYGNYGRSDRKQEAFNLVINFLKRMEKHPRKYQYPERKIIDKLILTLIKISLVVRDKKPPKPLTFNSLTMTKTGQHLLQEKTLTIESHWINDEESVETVLLPWKRKETKRVNYPFEEDYPLQWLRNIVKLSSLQPARGIFKSSQKERQKYTALVKELGFNEYDLYLLYDDDYKNEIYNSIIDIIREIDSDYIYHRFSYSDKPSMYDSFKYIRAIKSLSQVSYHTLCNTLNRYQTTDDKLKKIKGMCVFIALSSERRVWQDAMSVDMKMIVIIRILNVCENSITVEKTRLREHKRPGEKNTTTISLSKYSTWSYDNTDINPHIMIKKTDIDANQFLKKYLKEAKQIIAIFRVDDSFDMESSVRNLLSGKGASLRLVKKKPRLALHLFAYEMAQLIAPHAKKTTKLKGKSLPSMNNIESKHSIN